MRSEMTEEQNKIAETILATFLPASIKDYEAYVEIDTFFGLWPEENRPLLKDIERVMELLGFKAPTCRIDLYFLVKEPETETAEKEEIIHEGSTDDQEKSPE